MITGLDPAVAAALSQPGVTALYALRLDLPSGISRMHSGLGELVIGGEIYYGVGTLGTVSAQREQLSTSPTKLNVTLSGIDTSLLATIIREHCVGSLARLYLVVLDASGAPLNAVLQFKGRIESTPVRAGKNNAIQLAISNIFEEWRHGLPLRATDESHQRIAPGDRFFRYVTQMTDREIHWGSKKDAPGFRYS